MEITHRMLGLILLKVADWQALWISVIIGITEAYYNMVGWPWLEICTLLSLLAVLLVLYEFLCLVVWVFVFLLVEISI